MINIYFVLIMLCIVLFVVILVVYTRYNELSTRMNIIAKTMNECNKEIFDIENNLKNKDNVDLSKESSPNLKVELEEFSKSILNSINTLENNFSEFSKHMENRVENIENDLKDFNIRSKSYGSDDNTRIMNLYSKGMNSEDIAMDLGMSKSEVDFVIKIQKLNQE